MRRRIKAAAAVVLVIGVLTLVDDCGGDAIAAPQPPAASHQAPHAGR